MSGAADRVLSVLLLGLAAFIAVQANQLDVPFSYDPVGPKAFPMLLSGILGLLSVILFFRPGPGGSWPRGPLLLRLIGVLVLLGLYAWFFTLAGYLITTAITAAVLAWLFNSGPVKAVISGILLSIGSYLLFTYALGITLPWGAWLTSAA
ncbi:tripartite tricarboxylate transporter TctB family protein [Marinobacterium mangrovicola]|uniref:Putative tricarboxylic transport membrane protein n=1 Tax=Marinobacterium mangrovicola TaxID=1476959 RepID=A0A4R1HBB4_9GAMM|nr:tripartite tricarboxylate transporter TctB family protein [Marinobacterium mangrovicola]TCK16459.1 putative tricarboxylic transport membrane protein [Marinobacterium mangrovicola]